MNPVGLFEIRDLSHIRQSIDQDIAGIVGSGILNGGVYSIDFCNRTISLTKYSSAPQLEHEIRFDRQRPIVTVTVNGKDFPYVVDSGALQSSISRRAADLVVPESAMQNETSYKVLTIDGVRNEVRSRALIESFKFAGIELSSINLFVNEENVIGLDILRKGTLTVNARARRFSFNPEPKDCRPRNSLNASLPAGLQKHKEPVDNR